MSTLRNVNDMRLDALFRAGEPGDSTSSFWTKSLEYMNCVQEQLLLGGSIAAGRDLATSAGIYAHLVDTPITDWWWARRRGVFNTIAATVGTINGTLTQGSSTAITVSGSGDLTNVAPGHYIAIQNKPSVYRVVDVLTSTLQVRMDAAYVDDTQSGGTVTFAKMEYPLAGDFLRFASPPYMHGVFGSTMDVSTIEQRNTDWPLAIIRQGRMTRAFMVGPQTIAVNAYDTRPYRCEYEYIALPPDLVAGGTCVLPPHHRQVIASGAAMLMLFDKEDSRAANLASEYRELVGRMVQEHRKALSGGSSTFGGFRCRRPGIPKRAPQSQGEIFLV